MLAVIEEHRTQSADKFDQAVGIEDVAGAIKGSAKVERHRRAWEQVPKTQRGEGEH